MTEENPTPTPTDIAPKPTEPVATAPATDAPPWGEDFNAEKAWSLVQNLRADKEKLSKRPALTDEQKTKLSEYDRLAEASKTELERAQEAAKREADRATSLLSRAVKSEVKALAQGFADPEDAAAFLDLSKYATGDGDVESDSIKADLADLLQRKPHLGKSPETRVPAPNPAQGSSAGGAGASQITDRAQLAKMTPEEISQARLEGRLDRLMGKA